MPARSPNTVRVARRVRRRGLVNAALACGGWGLAAGAALGLVLVVVSRLGWVVLPWAIVLGLSSLAGLVAGLTWALRSDWSLLGAAQRADRASALKDRLSTALSLAGLGRQPTSSEAVAIEDGEAAAARLAPAGIVPLRLTGVWAVWPVVLSGAVALGVWMPVRSGATDLVSRRHASEPERRAAADVIGETAREARAAAEGSLRDLAGAEDLRRLEEIERDLLDGTKEPGEALAEGAKHLDRAAEDLDRAAEQADVAEQALRERLADSLTADEEDAFELARALSEGDLEGARQAARDLVEKAPSLTPEERARYAEEFRQLAEHLAQAAESQAPQPGQELSPGDAAPPADSPELADETDPERLRARLEQQGVDPAAAERMAEELAQRNAEREAQRQAAEDLRRLSDATRDAARDIEQPEQRPPGQEQVPEGQRAEPQAEDRPPADPQRQRDDQAGEPRPGEQRQGRPQDATDQKQATEGQPSDRAQPRKQGAADDAGKRGEADREQQGEGARTGREQAGDQAREEGAREGSRRDQAGDRTGEQAQGAEGDASGDQRADDQGGASREGAQGAEGAPQGEKEGQGAPGAQQGAEGSGKEPGGQAGGKGEQGSRPGAAPGVGAEPGSQGEAGRDGQGAGQDPGGVEGLQRQLERLAERGRGADQQRRAAGELREQARRLLEQATPEERRELERLARDMADRVGPLPPTERPSAGPAPGPEQQWQQEAFDARSDPAGEAPGPGQLIAEWYDNEAERPAGDAAPGPETAPIREAARGVERAIDRQAVPRSRQDLVRRVFESYRRRTEGASSGGAGSGGSGE